MTEAAAGGGSHALDAAGAPKPGARSRAALLSIASNAFLVVLKLVAGAVTGSVAILTEAIHSGVDLLASMIAYFSVKAAEEPADASHRYGHEKYENVAAAAEAILILVGSAIVVFQAVRALVTGAEVQALGFGIAVIAFSILVNLVTSSYLQRRARQTGSPALEGDAAHLRTDAYSSAGVLVGLVLVSATGATWVDPAVALLIAVVILVTGVRIFGRSWGALVDQALPDREVASIRAALQQRQDDGAIVGFHELRTRQAGTRRYVDVHVQFPLGTTLEDAHAGAHALQAVIEHEVRNADVLIHLEPADKVRAVAADAEQPADPTVGTARPHRRAPGPG